MDIGEKFRRLSPAGKKTAVAFIEFLLSREEEEGRDAAGASADPFCFPDAESVDTGAIRQEEPARGGSPGIILAEERPVEEDESAIDFADINARFSRREGEAAEPKPRVQKRERLDWL